MSACALCSWACSACEVNFIIDGDAEDMHQANRYSNSCQCEQNTTRYQRRIIPKKQAHKTCSQAPGRVLLETAKELSGGM